MFVGSSLADLKEFPRSVQREVGFSLDVAQQGGKADSAKPLKGFGGAGVLEVVENFQTDTYRAVYTVKLAGIIYVLHCFEKKSKTGVETSEQDKKLIQQRLRLAMEKHAQRATSIESARSRGSNEKS